MTAKITATPIDASTDRLQAAAKAAYEAADNDDYEQAASVMDACLKETGDYGCSIMEAYMDACLEGFSLDNLPREAQDRAKSIVWGCVDDDASNAEYAEECYHAVGKLADFYNEATGAAAD